MLENTPHDEFSIQQTPCFSFLAALDKVKACKNMVSKTWSIVVALWQQKQRRLPTAQVRSIHHLGSRHLGIINIKDRRQNNTFKFEMK
jgi:hypothetical protein